MDFIGEVFVTVSGVLKLKHVTSGTNLILARFMFGGNPGTNGKKLELKRSYPADDQVQIRNCRSIFSIAQIPDISLSGAACCEDQKNASQARTKVVDALAEHILKYNPE